MTGWVISLDGAQGFKKQYGEIPLRVLTAQDLGQIGLSTRARLDPLPEPLTPVDAGHAGTSEPEPLPLPPVLDPEDPEERDRAEEKGQPVTEEAEGEVEKEAHPSDVHDADDPSSASEKPPTDSVSEPATPTPVVPPEDPEESVATTTKEVVVTLGNDPGGSPVHWRVSTKGSPHAFVIGIPGQGKSVTTRKVIRDFEQQGLPSLVFDFHGDMAADPPAGAVVLDAALGLPFSPFEPDVESNRPINSTAWEIAEIIAYVAKLGEIQRNSRVRRAEEGVRRHRVDGQHSRGPPPDDARVRHRLGGGREGGGRQERCRATTHVHRLRTVPRGRYGRL